MNKKESLETEIAALAIENRRYSEALRKIANWEFPTTGEFTDNGSPLSFECLHGSNGARDYIRALATGALEAGE